MSKKTEELVEQLSQLSVLEMSELKSQLEEKWGVTAAAPAAVMATGPAPAAEEQAEEATDFKVTLKDSPADKKIAVIKVVREVTGLGLKDAKGMVESTPAVVKESAPKAEADEIKKKFEAAGATCELQGL